MFKKAILAVIRWTVFFVATVTAGALAFAAAGVVFTILKWTTEGEIGAALLMTLLGGVVVGAVWLVKRRVPQRSRPQVLTSAMASLAILAVVVSLGRLTSRFFVTPRLAVLCLRPFANVTSPLLVSALSEDEAEVLALEALSKHPDAALKQLPRLEALIRHNPPATKHGHKELIDLVTGQTFAARPFGAANAIEVIAGLGPRAAAAAPTLVEHVVLEVAEAPEASWHASQFDSLQGRSERDAWVALVRLGKPAVPAVTEGLKSAQDFKLRLVFVSVLRHLGEGLEPAAPVLVEILKAPGEGKERDECLERVLITLREIGPAAGSAVPIISPWALDERINPLTRPSITTLGFIGSSENNPVETLLKILDDPNWRPDSSMYVSRQQLAVETLGEIGADATSAIPRLRSLIDTPESRRILETYHYVSTQSDLAIKALARLGCEGLQEVVNLLPGPYSPSAVAAIGKLGPKGKAAAPALRELLAKAPPNQRVPLAMAIERVEGPSDEIVAVMAEEITSTPSAGATSQLLERFSELGPAAKAAEPGLTQLLTQPGGADRWRVAQVLWKVDHDAPAIRPAVVEMLKDESSKAWHRLDPAWLHELDPTGEQVVAALTEGISKSGSDTGDIVEALATYGKQAKSSLPAVQAAFQKSSNFYGAYNRYLWNLSAWHFFRYSPDGQLAALFMLCPLCLLVECVWFRWLGRRRAPAA